MPNFIEIKETFVDGQT